MAATAITPYNVKFRMWGRDYKVPSEKHYSEHDFQAWLFYARRLIGYVVAPRFCLIRLYTSEVIETIRKHGLYKHQIKRNLNLLVQELDSLEQRHKRRINEDFMEVMTNAMAGKGMVKTNELRGAMGGAMLNKGVQNYILYSYPYTLMQLIYDTKDTYAACMEKIRMICGIDFTNAFIDFRGDTAYQLSYKAMLSIVQQVGEKIPRLEMSSVSEKLNGLARIMMNEENMHDAFQEAADEVSGELPVDVRMMDVWIDEEEQEKEDITNKLKDKFKVGKL